MFSLAILNKAAWREVQIYQEKFFSVMVLKQWNIGFLVELVDALFVIVQEDDLANALHNIL